MIIEDIVEQLSHKHKLDHGLTWDVVSSINVRLLLRHKHPIKYFFAYDERHEKVYAIADKYFSINKYR